MSATEVTEQKSARPSAQAVDDEYEKLERFYVNGRRIVFIDEKDPPEGGFGIVRRAELHQSAYLPIWLASRQYGPPRLVAVKQIKISKMSNMKRVKRAFTREMFVWSSLGEHPGIAKFLGFYADLQRSEAWLLSPWEPNGNVSEFIKNHNLEVPERLSLIYDTIDALAFLHQLDPPVCHGDIKSANVLVSADYRARMCDFGLARLHEDSGFGRLETSTASKGSIRWCSPELIDGAPRAPTSDVYAWAWLVWEIMTGDLPYEGTSTDYAIIRKIFESPLLEVDGQSRLSDCLQVWELMTRCLKVDPQQRPTARMCKTTVTYLPRCTPTPSNADRQPRSAALLENLGDLESWKGNFEKGSGYLDEALRLYQEEADRKGIASVLRKQAVIAYHHSDYDKAITTATTALEYCRTLGDALGVANASAWLGFSLTMKDKDDEALPLLRESLESFLRLGNDVGAAHCLERIGEIQRYAGQEEKALSTLDEAVAVASQSGDQVGLARALTTIGLTHYDLSDLVKAADALSKAIEITRNIGWGKGLRNSLQILGRVKMRLGEYRDAEDLLQESISNARRGRGRLGLAQALETLGRCFREQSKLDEASSVLEEACLLYQELSRSRQDNSTRVASILVELKRSQGDWIGALFWHDHIISVCRSQKEQGMVMEELMEKGEIFENLRRYDEAALHFEAAIATAIEHGDFWDLERKRLCALPKVAMKWERWSPLLCDLRRLQRRQAQLVTTSLKLPIHIGRGEL